jgi:hypothetical protein
MVNKKRVLLIVGGFVCVVFALFAVVGYYNITNAGKINITITVAPKDSTILLDGNQLGGSSALVTPGKHTLKVSHPDFKSFTYNFNTNNTSNIPISLLASDNTGQDYASSHQQEFLGVEKVSSSQYNDNSTSLANNNPIVNQLPLDISPEYKIDYDASKKYPNDPQKIALYISANSSLSRHAAIQAIYTFGFDPSDYEIIFQPLGVSN